MMACLFSYCSNWEDDGSDQCTATALVCVLLGGEREVMGSGGSRGGPVECSTSCSVNSTLTETPLTLMVLGLHSFL